MIGWPLIILNIRVGVISLALETCQFYINFTSILHQFYIINVIIIIIITVIII